MKKQTKIKYIFFYGKKQAKHRFLFLKTELLETIQSDPLALMNSEHLLYMMISHP